jgi:hypothetical protein
MWPGRWPHPSRRAFGAPQDEGIELRSPFRHIYAIPRRVCTRVMRITRPSGNRRGRRECRVMASPMARLQTKKAGGSDHRLSRINPAFPARWCYGLYAPSPVSGLDSHRRLPFITGRLDPSVGRSGPRDFAVRVRHARPSCHPRPSHPRPTVRDDRPKRPSSSRRDARDAACDLPDEASGGRCGRLARRAKWAWGVCGICSSGVRVQCTSETGHLGGCDRC